MYKSTICLIACASATAAFGQTVRPAIAVTPRAEVRAEGATFRVGDVFELRMTGMPAEDAQPFSQQFTIGGDGYINVPFAGQVQARGLTQSQLERAIERTLIENKIFTRPTAIINVNSQGRFVTIGGQIRAPQRMIWSADLTLTSAITAAGGPGDFASDKIKFTRGGKSTIVKRKELAKNPELDVKVLPGDQIELQ